MKITIRQPKCFSEIGRKDNQEDFLWPNPQTVTKENRVFVMCDGVGGQDSGEVASETAATALGTFLTGHLPEDGVVTKAFFEEALSYAYDEMDKLIDYLQTMIIAERDRVFISKHYRIHSILIQPTNKSPYVYMQSSLFVDYR